MGDIIPNQLFVAGYSRSKVQDEKDVRDIFKKYGTIKEVAYKGSYSFVTFSNESEAQEALKGTNGQSYNGQKLKVDVVDNRKGRKTGPNEEDKCFKCNKGGHWARNCPNIKSPRRSRRRSDSRSKYKDIQNFRRRHRRSESRSYSSYSSSRSRRRRYQNKRKRHSRSPRRDQRIRKRSVSPKRSPSDSASSKRPNSNSKS